MKRMEFSDHLARIEAELKELDIFKARVTSMQNNFKRRIDDVEARLNESQNRHELEALLIEKADLIERIENFTDLLLETGEKQHELTLKMQMGERTGTDA